MTQKQVPLFFVRLGLYLAWALVPLAHPGVSVAYDVAGLWIWFVLVPAEMAVAFFLAPPRTRPAVWMAAALALVALSVALVARFESSSLGMVVAGFASFVTTVLVFRSGGRFPAVVFLEPLFPASLVYAYIGFTRGAASIAQSATGLPQALFFALAGGFLVHGLVLYLALSCRRTEVERRRTRRDGLVIGGLAAAALLAAFLVPPDFLEHQVVRNLLHREAQGEPIPVDAEGPAFLPNGNLRSPDARDGRGRNPFPGRDGRLGMRPDEGGEGRGSLEGIPADEWGDASLGSGGRQGRQRAVMVVASRLPAVYAAEAYRGELDSTRGFGFSKDEPLNELSYLRLLDTWKDPTPMEDAYRADESIFYLSTNPARVLAYRPRKAEPTILQPEYHPFEYSYTSVSAVSTLDYEAISKAGPLTAEEEAALSRYLQVEIAPEARKAFLGVYEDFLDGLGDGASRQLEYGQRIIAILKSFETFQYELGYDEDVSIAKLEDFVTNTKTGDCTEFSNTAAIMGRLLGIPSRVVVGYLASQDLQTDAHRRGTLMLQDAIPLLREFNPEELILVTTAHRHSWTQFFISGRGWVDIEATAAAMPPIPGMGLDPNEQPVVIPLIDPRPAMADRRIPWAAVGLAFAAASGAALVLLYLLRYGRETYLAAAARGNGPRAAKALFDLGLMKLAARGLPLKPRSATALEYARVVPESGELAQVTTELHFRTSIRPALAHQLIEESRTGYARMLEPSRPRRVGRRIKEALSLRGLHYL